jgi:NAD(P)H-flavin reductase/ferredoxin
MPKLIIRQWPVSVESRKGAILEAALAAGVPYPHGCRIGECGSCKSQLLAGEVMMGSYDKAVLSDDERAQGLVLACRAYPQTDVQVSWLDGIDREALPVERMTAQVTNIEAVTPQIRRLYVWPERQLRFAAGQYARLGFGQLPLRAYSMANRPDEDVLEFHVRLVPGDLASEYIAGTLKPGDGIRLEGPFGNAYLRPDHLGPIIAIAGGSGLAPMKSIIRTRLHAGSTRPIRLYFGVQSESGIYDEAVLNGLAAAHPNFDLCILVSSPDGPTRRRVGLLHEAVAEDLRPVPDLKCHVAGPPGMVEAVTATLIAREILRHDISCDAVYGSEDVLPLPGPGRLARLFGALRGG